jgi:hypothetical protein
MDLEQYDLPNLSELWGGSDTNPELQIAIEQELQKRIKKNTKFSREDLLLNPSMVVVFIPTSEAHRRYGACVQVSIVPEDEIIKNYLSQPSKFTYGYLGAEATLPEELTKQQIEDLITIGFSTRDILEIQRQDNGYLK